MPVWPALYLNFLLEVLICKCIWSWKALHPYGCSIIVIIPILIHICALFNTLMPRHNGYHFGDDSFKCISINENNCILTELSLKNIRISNKPTLVKIMAWRGLGEKPLLNRWSPCIIMPIYITKPQWVKPISQQFFSWFDYSKCNGKNWPKHNIMFISRWPFSSQYHINTHFGPKVTKNYRSKFTYIPPPQISIW